MGSPQAGRGRAPGTRRVMPFGFDWCRKSTTTSRTAAVDDDEGWLEARSVDVLKRSSGSCVACVLHNERYALAKVWDRRRMDSLSIASLDNELKALRDAQIQRGFLALASSPDTVALVTEYYPGGDLDTRRKRRGGTLSEDEVSFYAHDAWAALKAISELGWAHRDVKPENLCIDARGNVRLVDFGLSKFCVDGRCRTACGTVAFASPEVCDVALGIEEDYDGHTADLWSLGCVLLELKMGRLAWDVGRRVSPGKDAREALEAVRAAHRLLTPPPNELLTADPGRRRAVALSCDSEPPFVPRPRADAPAAVVRGARVGELCSREAGS